jgi:hypothetical protein
MNKNKYSLRCILMLLKYQDQVADMSAGDSKHTPIAHLGAFSKECSIYVVPLIRVLFVDCYLFCKLPHFFSKRKINLKEERNFFFKKKDPKTFLPFNGISIVLHITLFIIIIIQLFSETLHLRLNNQVNIIVKWQVKHLFLKKKRKVKFNLTLDV